jgi:hypothetical protein
MKFNLKLVLVLAPFVAIGVGVLGVSWWMNASIPSAIKPCVPRSMSTRVVAQTIGQPPTYYLLRLSHQDATHQDAYYDHVVLVNANHACIVAYSDPHHQGLPLSRFLPQTVANQLTLGQFRRAQRAIGQAEFHQRITTALAAGSTSSLPPEQVWALQQLGFTLPKQP